MNGLYILLGASIILAITLIIARFLNVKLVDIISGKIEFWQPVQKSTFLYSPNFSLDPVISSDGKIVKIHIMVSILSEKELSPNNWILNIRRIGRFSFQQYFVQDENGNRIPLGKIAKLPLKSSESFTVGLEFEPEKDHQSLKFYKGKYQSTLVVDTVEGKCKKSFSFRVNNTSLLVLKLTKLEAERKKIPIVTSFPIV